MCIRRRSTYAIIIWRFPIRKIGTIRKHTSRIKCVLLSLVIITALVVSYAVHCDYLPSSKLGIVEISRPGLFRKKSPDLADAAEMNNLNPVGRVVDTLSCVIPDFDPYSPVVAKNLTDPPPEDIIVCNTSWPMLTDVVDGHVVWINVSLSLQLNVSYCEYQEVCQCTD